MSNYVQKYYKELFTKLLETANSNGLISHNDLFTLYVNSKQDISSFYVMTLSILADNIEDVYYDMTTVYESAKVEYALDEDLDNIGDIIGCPRPQATRSGVELTFTLTTEYDETITVPSNQIVSTINNNIQYYTTEPFTIPSGETEAKVSALSMGTGSDYRVPPNSLTRLQSNILNNLGETIGFVVTNDKSSCGGKEAYTDEEYRNLLMNWTKEHIKGSREAYERYFATVDGLKSYTLLPNWNGITGTLKIVLEPGTPYQLKKCYDEIMSGVCQFSEDIVMSPPVYVPIDINAKCNVDIDMNNQYSATEKLEIKSRIEDAIHTFIEGNIYDYEGLSVGEDFIPYQLGVFLAETIPELKSISFYSHNHETNTMEIDNTPITISNEELGVCGQNINIEIE